jgi:hypothetical protein
MNVKLALAVAKTEELIERTVNGAEKDQALATIREAIAACEALDAKGIPFPPELDAMLDMIIEVVNEADDANSQAKMLLN